MNTHKRVTTMLMTVLVGLCFMALWLPADTQAGVLNRLGASYIRFDGTETFTALAATAGPPAASGGAVVLNRPVLVPALTHTLYLTMSATTDAHGGSRNLFAALVNGVSCKTNPIGIDGAPNGWITLLHIPAGTGATNCNNGGGGDGDCHDNATYYTWCCRITPPTAPTIMTATWKMATFIAGQNVFLEKAHFYVDGTDGFGGQCSAGSGTPGLSDVQNGTINPNR